MWMKHVYFALSPLKTISLEELTTHKDKKNAFCHFYIHAFYSSLTFSLLPCSISSIVHSCTTYPYTRMVLSLRERLIDRGEIEPKRKTLYRFFIHRCCIPVLCFRFLHSHQERKCNSLCQLFWCIICMCTYMQILHSTHIYAMYLYTGLLQSDTLNFHIFFNKYFVYILPKDYWFVNSLSF